MNRRRIAAGAIGALATALAAFAPSAWGASTIDVAITRPLGDRPAFGEVEVEVSVSSLEPVRKIELFVDGRFAGTLERPPFRWSVDVGQENRAHRFEALAEDINGQRTQVVLETPALGVDEEIDVALQQIFVTARRGGQLVADLDRDDLTVLDQGEPQELVTFERGDVPLTVLLALDASHSMRGERLAVALAAARSFVGRMQTLDQASLLLFADRILYRSPFTGFREILGTGLGGVEAEGGTALSDHLYVALKLLEGQQGRRALILLTDGFDTTSVLRMREVVSLAQRGQAMIYWLRLREPGRELAFTSTWHDSADYRDELATLGRMVHESGGDVVPLADTDEAAEAFASILHELRAQYVLGYYPSTQANDGRWHDVRVRAGRNGIKLRYREGYLDF